jgi:large conductance mechanosensitive channel
MLEGFRNFLFRGNVVDLATAVIIGVAFGGVIDAFTKAIIDPLFAAIGGSPNLDTALTIPIGPAKFEIGRLLTAILNFLIKAAVIYFGIIRPFGPMAAKLAAAAAPPDVVLLGEIRDLLKR